MMAVPQVVVIALLLHVGHRLACRGGGRAAAGARRADAPVHCADPWQRALWYSGFGVPLFVAGMMVSAFALAFGSEPA